MNMLSSKALLSTPVVIIGAGRSGTNMLRDVLTEADVMTTWPCDEINYIWRHGNRELDTDEYERSHATADVCSYIRDKFNALSSRSAQKSGSAKQEITIEKTCANSLRVGFVDQVLPEAKFIYLVRDGRDVVSSAMKRWKAPLNIPYLYAKARYVPASDLYYYGSRYFMNRVAKFRNSEARLSVWGPKFKDWRGIVEANELSTVCAHQWVRCIERSEEAFRDIPKERVYRLRYEDYVNDPVTCTARIIKFLGVSLTDEQIEFMCRGVSSSSIGKGAKGLGVSDSDLKILEPSLKLLGYT